MHSILFVCTANVCRSPTAQVLFESMLRARGEFEEWWVDSAGTHAPILQPATELAQRVMAERGLDLSRHRSKRVDRRVIQPFKLVLVMEAMHQELLVANYPDRADRIHLLAKMAGEDGPVEDPVGGSLQHYRAMADRVTDLLARGLDRIRALAREAG